MKRKRPPVAEENDIPSKKRKEKVYICFDLYSKCVPPIQGVSNLSKCTHNYKGDGCSIIKIPPEIILVISGYSDSWSILSLLNCCKHFREVYTQISEVLIKKYKTLAKEIYDNFPNRCVQKRLRLPPRNKKVEIKRKNICTITKCLPRISTGYSVMEDTLSNQKENINRHQTSYICQICKSLKICNETNYLYIIRTNSVKNLLDVLRNFASQPEKYLKPVSKKEVKDAVRSRWYGSVYRLDKLYDCLVFLRANKITKLE